MATRDGPNIKMMANSPAAVAAAFSNSWTPTSAGESCWAAIPDPTTTVVKKALPNNSARSRRHSGCSPTGSPASLAVLQQQEDLGPATATARSGRLAQHAAPEGSVARS